VKITAHLALIIAAVFSLICFGVAIQGFTSLGEIADPVQLSDAKGFAGFWAFLGLVGVACGVGSHRIARAEKEDV
jgi:hypothetical protein